MKGRDSKGQFTKGNVPWNKGITRKIGHEEEQHVPAIDPVTGALRLIRLQVTCPACGEQVIATAVGGRVKGYCAVARRYVDFPVEA